MIKSVLVDFLKNSYTGCKRCSNLRALHQSRYTAAPTKVAQVSESVQEGSGKDAGVWTRRVVTGLQPTGALHVGNYFAALRRAARLQASGDPLILFIADLHCLTTKHDPQALDDNTLHLTALALAAGVAPEAEGSALFRQSAVPRHAELCWVLTCLTSPERLSHLPQLREKAGSSSSTPAGLLLYPVLQAADVLAHRGTHVPVGVDQLPHLQLAAQLARSFNKRYGRTFPEPKPLLPEDGSDRIRSLRDPLRKMSKSDPDPRSRLQLADDDQTIALKIRKAVTDCNPEVTFDPASRPGVSNLVQLHCLVSDLVPEEAVEEAAGLTTAQYKGVVAAALQAELRPVRERYLALLARPRVLRDVLRAGAARARLSADETYADVAARLGLTAPALPATRLSAAAAAAAAK